MAETPIKVIFFRVKGSMIKVVLRCYFTHVKQVHMDPGSSNKCCRGHLRLGTSFHMWWTCSMVHSFWMRVLPPPLLLPLRLFLRTAVSTLFSVFPEDMNQVILLLLAAAKIEIAHHWNHSSIFTLEGCWQCKVWKLAVRDKLTQKNKLSRSKTNKKKDKFEETRSLLTFLTQPVLAIH